MGHESVDCRLPKKNNKNHEANAMNDITQDVSDINLSTMVSELNLVGPTRKNGGLTLVPLNMCAQTKGSSLLSNQLMGKKFSWETLLLLLLKDEGRCC